MAHFDFPLEVLRAYQSPDPEPSDFDEFWKQTLTTELARPVDAKFEDQKDPVSRHIRIWDATYRGYGGQAVKGWFLAPANATGSLPCIVTFLGYGGGRGLPESYLLPPACGFAHFIMDTRGQGARGVPGDTPDEAPSGPTYPGFMTRGIESRDTYYYRRVFTDAVRAFEAAASHPLVDKSRIAVSGGSQGGGISLAAAALLGDRAKLLMADVPFLCHFRRAVSIIDTYPYDEIIGYLRTKRGRTEQVFQTLSYFDGVNFARRVKARTLFSVALMDNICPPSTVYAAYNALDVPKEIRVYDFNTHEGGGMVQDVERMRFALEHL